MRFTRTVAVIACLAAPLSAGADAPVNGLGGLTVSPDGKTVLVTGDNRTMFVVDAETMEVTRRVWIKTSPVWLQYNKSGDFVFLRDTSGRLQALNSDTFETEWSFDNTLQAAYAPDADQLAFTLREKKSTIVMIIDGQELFEIDSYEIPEFRASALALSSDGMRATLTSWGEKRPDEEKITTPSDLKGVEKMRFKHEHDQRGSKIAVIDIESNSEPEVVESWFTPNNVKAIAIDADDTYLFGSFEETALIAPDGAVTFFDAGTKSLSGGMIAADKGWIVSGHRSEVTIKPRDSDAAKKLKIDSLPGWAEYVIRFAPSPDGRTFASTSGYRLVRISEDGDSIEARPIY